jgi:4-diphosphocytidyl-2-C-methyl-D-erythritol kinase
MSGSGGTCFGLFENAGTAAAASRAIEAQQPAWWVKPAVLGGPLLKY